MFSLFSLFSLFSSLSFAQSEPGNLSNLTDLYKDLSEEIPVGAVEPLLNQGTAYCPRKDFELKYFIQKTENLYEHPHLYQNQLNLGGVWVGSITPVTGTVTDLASTGVSNVSTLGNVAIPIRQSYYFKPECIRTITIYIQILPEPTYNPEVILTNSLIQD